MYEYIVLLCTAILPPNQYENENEMETEELLSWQQFKAWEGFDQKVSIHSTMAIQFYEETLGADKWVLNVLKNKLRLPLPTFVPCYWERNNKSAVKEMDFLWGKMTEWERQGFVLRVKDRPHCINPLSVVKQLILQTGESKLRPCLDVSRLLNKLMPDEKVTLSDLSVSEKLVDKNDYLMSMDLENQYFHVMIQEDQWTYLGCQVEDTKVKEKHFFVFKVMIYGLKNAVRVVTRLTKPIVAKLHSEGCKFSIYIDDGRSAAKSAALVMKHHQRAISLFHRAGWNIQWKKTGGIPLQSQYHMGFITCTTQMIYGLPDFKIKHLQRLLGEIIDKYERGVQLEAREFAKMLGSLVSGLRALGQVIRASLRSAHICLDKAVTEEQSWNTQFYLPPTVAADLAFVLDNLEAENGQPIIKGRTGPTLNSLFPQHGPLIRVDNPIKPRMSAEVWGGRVTSDSSEWKKFAFSSDMSMVFSENMSWDEQQLSSGHRELLAALGAIRDNQDFFRGDSTAHRIFYWLTDSQNLETWAKKGSSIPQVQQDLMKMFRLQAELCMRIVFIWAPRDHQSIVLADMGSKFKDSDNWSICDSSFKALELLNGAKFTCDVFAHSSNNRVTKFYSKVPSLGSSGINAFAQDWCLDEIFICPPVKMIPAVILQLVSQACCGVLVVPEWKTSIFWPLITEDGIHYLDFVQKIHKFSPAFKEENDSSHTVFRPGNRVNMVALFINSNQAQKDMFKRCSMGGCKICTVRNLAQSDMN